MSVGISVITAVYNAEAVLPGLIASLRAQTDQNFEWIVVDGQSSDRTLQVLHEAGALVARVISEADFGIYDALNKGVRVATGDYYLVLGADDVLRPDAIALYRAAVQELGNPPDVVTAGVLEGGVVHRARPGLAWLCGLQGYVSTHSIGALIRRSLHDEFGFYSRKFPICADQLFLKRVGAAGARIKVCDFIAGEFGTGGVSSVDTVGVLTEFFRVQLLTERYKSFQVFIFIVRLLKRYFRL